MVRVSICILHLYIGESEWQATTVQPLFFHFLTRRWTNCDSPLVQVIASSPKRISFLILSQSLSISPLLLLRLRCTLWAVVDFTARSTMCVMGSFPTYEWAHVCKWESFALHRKIHYSRPRLKLWNCGGDFTRAASIMRLIVYLYALCYLCCRHTFMGISGRVYKL